jgi:hypothetical protein
MYTRKDSGNREDETGKKKGELIMNKKNEWTD